jgi:hypothetical protein
LETLRKFEGASLDDILAHVYRECGANATIVEANRIRRGGVGGFFAKEGFEVVVIPEPGLEPTAAAAPSASHDETDPAPRGARLDVTEDEDELLADFLAGRATMTEPVSVPAPVPVAVPVTRPAATAPAAVTVPAAAEEIETLPARRLLKAARITDHGNREQAARALHPSVAPLDDWALEPVVALVGSPEPEFSFSNVFDQVLAEEHAPAASSGAGPQGFDDVETLGDVDDGAFDRLLLFGDEEIDADGTLSDDELRALLGVENLGDAVRAGGPSGSAGSSLLTSQQGGTVDDHATVADWSTSGAPDLRADTVAIAMTDDVAAGEPTVDGIDTVGPVDLFDADDLFDAVAPESTLDALTRRFTTVDPTGAITGATGPAALAEPTAVVSGFPTDAEAGTTVEPEVAAEAPAPAPTRRRTRTTATAAGTTRARARTKATATTKPKPAAKPAGAKARTAKQTTAAGTTRKAKSSATAKAARPAPAGALDLMARFAAVPTAPEAPAAGTVVVVGTPADALVVARKLAGGDTPIVLASPDAGAADAPGITVVPDVEAAARLRAGAITGRARRVATPHRIVVVDAGTGTRGLAWARRVVDVLEPDHVRLAVHAGQAGDDVRATADLLDDVVALDVVTGDGDAVAVDDLLAIGVPVGSVGGWPASPALWAALTLEGTNRG